MTTVANENVQENSTVTNNSVQDNPTVTNNNVQENPTVTNNSVQENPTVTNNSVQEDPTVTNNNVQSKNNKQQKQQQPKVVKPKKTAYWGIQLDVNAILEHDVIKNSLVEKSNLIPQKHMHSTMLYVGKKDDERELLFTDHREKMCSVIVTGHGLSDSALALQVEGIKFSDSEDVVPTFATIQHVTVALASGIKAVDSIKSFDEGVITQYGEKLVLSGKLKQYFF